MHVRIGGAGQRQMPRDAYLEIYGVRIVCSPDGGIVMRRGQACMGLYNAGDFPVLDF